MRLSKITSPQVCDLRDSDARALPVHGPGRFIQPDHRRKVELAAHCNVLILTAGQLTINPSVVTFET